jgi:hypothetical protein
MFACSGLTANDNKLTDPMRPAVVSMTKVGDQEGRATAFTLSKIFHGKYVHQAVINDRTVMEGDSVQGAKVVAINKNSVDLLIDGAIKKLSIAPSFKRYKK